jgi:hypothetical protein
MPLDGQASSQREQALTDRLALLALAGLLAFTPPVLLTVNKAVLILGIPLLYLWLASLWLLLIIGVMVLNRRLQRPSDAPAPPPAENRHVERQPQLPPMGD